MTLVVNTTIIDSKGVYYLFIQFSIILGEEYLSINNPSITSMNENLCYYHQRMNTILLYN